MKKGLHVWGHLLAVPIVILGACSLLALQDCQAATSKKRAQTSHGQNWSFGYSRDRYNPLWQQSSAHSALLGKSKSKAAQNGAMDTRGGIDRALSDAVPKVRTDISGHKKKAYKPRGTMGMSMDNESSSWKVNPGEMRADEYMPRDNRHVVRAFAGVKAGDDLDIRVGPELHLRDESKGTESAHEKQPDSVLGLGMSFKLDF